jgi:predicted DNA-binding transcriptional regulator
VTTIRKGSDLLDWAQAKKKNIRIKRRLISATFKMELEGRKSDLAITVRPPNVAIYSRGPVSSTIEDWLSQRGFIISKQPPRKPRHEPALASN